ncbi:polysaccharide biosynthesis protein [Gillisia sp. M10.2A]|uniref:Polysaccharide biosynthesis protein n=1 Tax=Gillisia lutea TaxID=2909668 RepID=A0ABS9EH15_9FLAO|nr:polysaccharide biosynthesis protein [Gillisia lutea]MCF4102177.1 polysaccharide biosynthesis protein [Gillisia lutea]
MKLLTKVLDRPFYAKAWEWGRLITITGAAQGLIQIIGFISGILIIRLLPTQEYALYILANTMLGTMTILADAGISTGVMAQGGKVWQDKKKLGSILVTGFDLRRKFAFYCLLISIPILLYLLRHHGASWLMSILIIVSIIPAFLTTLSGSLLEIAPKLKQDIHALQKIQIGGNFGRLLLLTLTLFIFPWAFIAIFAAGLPQFWVNIKQRKLASGYVDWKQIVSPVVRKEILSFVKLIFPGAVYYCLSGQITIWILSLFGTTTDVANMGALGRLGMALSVFSMLFGILVLPRFARLPSVATVLFSRFVIINTVFIILSVLIIGVVWVFPSQVLWILGKDYSYLQYELILSIIGSCTGLLAGALFGLFTSRGWAIKPYISIPLSILSLVLGAVIFDVSNLRGVLMFNIFIIGFQALMNGSYCLLKIMFVEKKISIN